MSDDLLARATRALRERDDADEAPAPVLETRHRVLATLRQQRARRVVWLRRVLPLAAVLVGSSAWAAANGHLGGAMHRAAAYVGLAEETPEDGEGTRAQSTAGPVAPSSAAPPLVAPPPVAPSPPPSDVATSEPADEAPSPVAEAIPSPPVVDPAPSSAPRSREPDAAPSARAPRPVAKADDPLRSPKASTSQVPGASAAPAAASAPEPTDDPGRALYADAHHKHFGERDFAGALVAWEAYLRAAPGGRFAAEAQYNRAICLVRLGRTREARAALQAFADGGFGGYRQAEAKALLDALPAP